MVKHQIWLTYIQGDHGRLCNPSYWEGGIWGLNSNLLRYSWLPGFMQGPEFDSWQLFCCVRIWQWLEKYDVFSVPKTWGKIPNDSVQSRNKSDVHVLLVSLFGIPNSHFFWSTKKKFWSTKKKIGRSQRPNNFFLVSL